jgi:type III secretory pathway component EscV
VIGRVTGIFTFLPYPLRIIIPLAIIIAIPLAIIFLRRRLKRGKEGNGTKKSRKEKGKEKKEDKAANKDKIEDKLERIKKELGS